MNHSPKKVVHIINELGLGGSETALYRLLHAMRDTKYAFTVIVLRGPGHYSSSIEQLHIPIHYLTLQKLNIISGGFRLLQLIQKIKPDIVQTWLYHADLLGGLCAKWCGVQKIIWGIRCEGVHLKRTTRWVKKIAAYLSHHIPNAIATNSHMAANNHIQAGYDAKKMRVIYNGFLPIQRLNEPDDALQPLLNLLNDRSTDSKPMVIGTLGRYHPDKDYPNFIQAIDTICSLHANVYFVLCGQGCNTDNLELQALLSTIINQNKIVLINGTRDPYHYLNLLDVFVLPSKTESFPNSLAEAMLCERPCIATDVGETHYILGDTGLIIPSEDPKRLAAACLTVLSKPQHEKIQLGIQARQRIEHYFSMDGYVNQMKTMYEIL